MLVLLHVHAFISPACASEPPAAGAPTIVVAVPSQGPQAETGRAIRAGVVRAVADLAARPVTSGSATPDQRDTATPVLLDVDDGCNADAAEARAREIVARRPPVDLVIGHPCPSAAVAAARIYAAAGVVFIAPATTHPRLTEQRAGATIFRLAGRADAAGTIAARHLAKHFAASRIAVISDKSAYGQALADRTRRELARLRVTDIVVGHLTPAEKDYSALVDSLAKADVRAILLAGFPIEALQLLAGLRAAGREVTMVLGDVAGDVSQFASLPHEARASVRILLPPPPRAFGPAADTLAARLAADGEPATLAAITAYGAIEVWDTARALARARAGTTDPDLPRLVATAIATTTFTHTILGPVTFDRRGDADITAFAVHLWRDGKLVPEIVR